MKGDYLIRRARDADLGRLAGIERAAAAMFRESSHPRMADAPLSCEHIGTSDVVWVACEPAGGPVGFAIVRAMPPAMHLQEIDVHPAHARHGIGAALIEAIACWAAEQGAERLTLTTFGDIPWNGPYYARLGFRRLSDHELSPALVEVRRAEQAAGLPMESRICMARVIDPGARGQGTKIPGAGNTPPDTDS